MKFTLGFILGAATAAVIVHYLNSEEGEAMVEKLKKDGGDLGNKLAELGKEMISEAKSAVGIKTEGPKQHWPVAEPELPLTYNNIN